MPDIHSRQHACCLVWDSEAFAHILTTACAQMYKYNGEDTGAEALTAFAREGYKGTAALDVPKEISPLDIALKRLQGNVPMVRQSCLACPVLVLQLGSMRIEALH